MSFLPPTVEGWSLVRKLGEGMDGVVALYKKGSDQAVFKFPTAAGVFNIQMENTVLQNIARKKPIPKHLVGATPSVSTHGQFVVQQFVEGITLEDFVRKYNITPDLAINITEQIRQGVKALHDVGYAHNDLHLGNVLINPQTYEVYIIDYGRSTPVDWPLTSYLEERWRYPIPSDDRVKVSVRDDAFVAASSALLNAAAKHDKARPLSNTVFNALSNLWVAAGNASLTKSTLNPPQPLPPPVVEPPKPPTPVVEPPKPPTPVVEPPVAKPKPPQPTPAAKPKPPQPTPAAKLKPTTDWVIVNPFATPPAAKPKPSTSSWGIVNPFD
jgi:serine/threonine protein kinase